MYKYYKRIKENVEITENAATIAILKAAQKDIDRAKTKAEKMINDSVKVMKKVEERLGA